MEYINEKVRRQDRLLTQERALQLLSESEYGVLSMIDDEGLPYAIPVNHVWNGENSIYIHCAPQGKKLVALQHNPNVSYCIVGKVNLLPKYFTTEYESVILFGKAHLQLTDEEKKHALRLLVKKLSAGYEALGEKYTQKSFHRVEVIRIDFTSFSGKCKAVKQAD